MRTKTSSSAIANLLNRTFVGASLANSIFSWSLLPVATDSDYPLVVALAKYKDGCILDVGANMGQSSAYFARKLRGKPIVAIEPRNLRRHRKWLLGALASEIQYVQAATSAEVGDKEVTLFTPRLGPFVLTQASGLSRSSVERLVSEIWPTSSLLITLDSVQVPVVTVDQLNLYPALMKIDIEGSEVACLTGSLDTLRRSHPILCIEAHTQSPEIFQILQAIGYVIHVRREGSLVEISESSQKGTNRNIICVHNTDLNLITNVGHERRH